MMALIITPAGEARCVYGEDVDLSKIGLVEIRRASHVEPDVAGQWWADLCPIAGPRLGPCRRRSQAVAAELRWLNEHLFSH